MSADVIRFAMVALLPSILMLLWFVAELHWRRWVRLAIGIANALLLVSWLLGVIYTYDLVTGMYYSSLSRMDRLLEERQEAVVRQALRVHKQTFQESRSAKQAVFRLSSVLFDLKAVENTPAATKDRQNVAGARWAQ